MTVFSMFVTNRVFHQALLDTGHKISCKDRSSFFGIFLRVKFIKHSTVTLSQCLVGQAALVPLSSVGLDLQIPRKASVGNLE